MPLCRCAVVQPDGLNVAPAMGLQVLPITQLSYYIIHAYTALLYSVQLYYFNCTSAELLEAGVPCPQTRLRLRPPSAPALARGGRLPTAL